MIYYHAKKILNSKQMLMDEAVHEFYIYMKNNDWYRLRQYEGRNKASIKTWMSTVAYRFFLQLHEDISKSLTVAETIPVMGTDSLCCNEYDEKRRKVYDALSSMTNGRYKTILIKMYFEGKTRKETAAEMNIDIDYFYVLYRRAENQFKKFYDKPL